MTCPVCGGYTMIIDSRNKDDHKKRRRICQECGYKFNTIEIDMDLYLKMGGETMIELTIENLEEVLAALEYLRNFSSLIGGTGMEYLNDRDKMEFIKHLNVLEDALIF